MEAHGFLGKIGAAHKEGGVAVVQGEFSTSLSHVCLFSEQDASIALYPFKGAHVADGLGRQRQFFLRDRGQGLFSDQNCEADISPGAKWSRSANSSLNRWGSPKRRLCQRRYKLAARTASIELFHAPPRDSGDRQGSPCGHGAHAACCTVNSGVLGLQPRISCLQWLE